MEKEKWLILDDSLMELRLMELALAPYGDKIQLLLAGTISETRELLEKNDFSVCLLDFYLKRHQTSEGLISEIRSTWPSIPIVVVSSQTEKSTRLHKAGADSVIPKLADTVSFGKSIMSAVIQAKTLRQLRVPSISLRKTYISEKAKVAFRQALKRNSGNILVVSPSGMGRTDFALALGERLKHRYQVTHGDALLTVSCKEFVHNSDSLTKMILGSNGNEDNPPTPGLLNQARTSVLIIDDAHLMPKELQEQIKMAFEKGFFKLSTGEKIRTARLRLILAAQEGEDHNFIQGFLQKVVSFQIKIPTFAGMLNELSEIIGFWFRRYARERRQRAMKMSRSFRSCLAEKIKQTPTRVTMRSVARTIETAIENALDDNRLVVTGTDLGDLEFLFEDLPTQNGSTDEFQMLAIPIDDPVGIAAWKELYALLANSQLEDTISLVRRIAIMYALARTKGNCSKAAKILGIARQSLYKENLREHTLREGSKHGHGTKGVIGTPIESDDI